MEFITTIRGAHIRNTSIPSMKELQMDRHTGDSKTKELSQTSTISLSPVMTSTHTHVRTHKIERAVELVKEMMKRTKKETAPIPQIYHQVLHAGNSLA